MYNQLGKGRKSYSLVQFPRIQLKNGLKKSVKTCNNHYLNNNYFRSFRGKIFWQRC